MLCARQSYNVRHNPVSFSLFLVLIYDYLFLNTASYCCSSQTSFTSKQDARLYFVTCYQMQAKQLHSWHSVPTTRARYALHYCTWFGSVCTGLYFFLPPSQACGELIDCTWDLLSVFDTRVVLAAVPAYRVVCDIFSCVLLPSAFRQGLLNMVSRSCWLQTGRGPGKVLSLRELVVVRASHSESYANVTLLTAYNNSVFCVNLHSEVRLSVQFRENLLLTGTPSTSWRSAKSIVWRLIYSTVFFETSSQFSLWERLRRCTL